jgi:uncharacterized phiE125 gp8 family phage protein
MVTNVQFTPGTLEVVTLAQAKKQLRLEASFNDEDDLIQSYIDAAVANAENFIGGHIIPGDLVITYDKFESPVIFEAFPLKTITSVKYYADEAEETLDSEKYALTKQSEKVYKLRFKEDTPTTAERFDAVTITVACGFAGNVIPKPVIQAVKMMVAQMYEYREDSFQNNVFNMTNSPAYALLRPYKKY